MKRTDANQAEIVEQLRAIGCTVQDLSGVGRGTPDILVGYRGQNLLMEIKTKSGRLNPRQVEWFTKWHGQSSVVTCFEDALQVINGVTL